MLAKWVLFQPLSDTLISMYGNTPSLDSKDYLKMYPPKALFYGAS
jgi:hypothetical protein